MAGGSQVTVMETIAAIEGLLGRKLEVDHKPPATGDPRKTETQAAAHAAS